MARGIGASLGGATEEAPCPPTALAFGAIGRDGVGAAGAAVTGTSRASGVPGNDGPCAAFSGDGA